MRAGAGVLRLERARERLDRLVIRALEQPPLAALDLEQPRAGRGRRAGAAPRRRRRRAAAEGDAVRDTCDVLDHARAAASGLNGLVRNASAPASAARPAAPSAPSPVRRIDAEPARARVALQLGGRARARRGRACARRARPRRAAGGRSPPRPASRCRPRPTSTSTISSVVAEQRAESLVVVDEQQLHQTPLVIDRCRDRPKPRELERGSAVRVTRVRQYE